MHEHDGHGLADDLATAQHDHVGPGDLNIVADEQLLDALGSAGQKSCPPLHDPAHVLRMQGVDVF